ncbi:MAG: site-specific DNA-methyltransferase [Thermoplasmata archaeon]
MNEIFEPIVYYKDSRDMHDVKNSSVHLIVTSPPYFNTKDYSKDRSGADLGNIDDLDIWLKEIGKVWKECHRVLSPGRKMFINIMNLPITVNNTFRSLNLVGKTTDLCESMGFIFKRDIIWHKTNSVRAPFGSYPYPVGILINNMHESILEFEKQGDGRGKYGHLTENDKKASKLPKDFWLKLKNSDVWVMKPYKSGTREHLAPFPDELPYRLIKGYSYVSETVLDPFLGMGTTLKVARCLGRRSIGYEINESYKQLIDKAFSQKMLVEF